MKNKLLVIVGPTATGKTSLAIQLAKIFDGELVSSDSRQVYKKMDIGTGKDLPKNSKTEKLKNSKLPIYYEVDGVRVWGYDLVNPRENFSVAQYVEIAHKVIKDIIKRNKLPILVGGTGLYVKAVVDGIATVTISPNLVLRKNLEGKTTEGLFEILAEMDPVKAAALNISDKKNPRRLVRAIEIADRQVASGSKLTSKKYPKYDTFFVGLTAPRVVIYSRIIKRVDTRLNGGFETEVRQLLKMGVSWKSQSMQSLGYKQFKDYFDGALSQKEAVGKWISEEKKYSKRQITWFKKDKRINWVDISKAGWQESVEKRVRKWHNR